MMAREKEALKAEQFSRLDHRPFFGDVSLQPTAPLRCRDLAESATASQFAGELGPAGGVRFFKGRN